MEAGKYSYMAEQTALFRAAHQVLDNDPKILLDPLALTLLGKDTERRINAQRELYKKPHMVKARTFTILRSRYTEDELSAAINRGVRQYVILGAGLDTSPYRTGHPSEPIDTYEIDHPDTQRWKLDRLKKAQIPMRKNLRHVAVDFERQSLIEGLAESDFDFSQPAFFSWLGVNYYLRPASVRNMFEKMASSAPSSQVVFDFVVDDSELDAAGREDVAKISRYADKQKEPWLSRYSPSKLEDILREAGFNDVFYFSRDLATARYLKDRPDGLAIHPAIQMMSAII
ncbi:MAG: class I SAM-dependent methyltransferase [Gammaproteobacteria bacterium]|nr:class I SAM-dependent methyltransferase [Gammaproteobacteria bacterium]